MITYVVSAFSVDTLRDVGSALNNTAFLHCLRVKSPSNTKKSFLVTVHATLSRATTAVLTDSVHW